MNRKVLNYLNNKGKEDYTFLDNILTFYLSGEFYNLLSNSFTQVEFYPSIKKNGNSIQVYFNYYNISAILDFEEEHYEYCKYEQGCSVEELESSIIKEVYDDEFDIEVFIINFIKLLENDERLIKLKPGKREVKRKNKLYSVISIISLSIPITLIILLAVYVFAFNKEIRLNWWFLLIIIIPMIIWFIFDIKSKK